MSEKITEIEWKPVQKVWTPIPEAEPEVIAALETIKGLQPIVARLLAQRGITTEELLRHFFNPSTDDLHDPFLMLGMEKAVGRIMEAINKGEKIMIFGDYDVDGTTATALFYLFLSRHYPHAICYIPDRYKEGYGISTEGIQYAKAEGITLIIALDCGIKSVDKVRYASELGIDFIICDHHLPGEEIPHAVAVLDPKQSNCSYPYKELSGCGVGFKLLQGLCLSLGWDQGPLFAHLDLLAISIAADIVPITGENRVLTRLGLQQLNQNPSPGIRALLEVSGFRPKPDNTFDLKVDRLVFGLAPRINAAGRIGHGLGAVQLLISQSLDEAQSLVGLIDDQNLERKELDRQITLEAISLIRESGPEDFSTVLFQPHWHKGVVGIVASRCIEFCHRPTIILTESNGLLTGSARSIRGLDLYEALDACREHLLQFGGHFFAAGLSLLPENLEKFKIQFEQVVRERITAEELVPRIPYDLEIKFHEINQILLKQIQRIGPFGPKNLNPLFCTKGLIDNGYSRLLEGKNGGPGHIRFEFPLENKNTPGLESGILEGIGFGLGGFWEILKSRQPFDILYHVEENEFRGQKKIQLSVKAIKPSED